MLDALLLAAQPLLRPAFALWGSPVTWLECVAAALGLAMVACNLRVNPAGWPLALVSSALYALLFADSKLYGEAALQFVFMALAVWGWWVWLRPDKGVQGSANSADETQRRAAKAPRRVAHLSARARLFYAAATLAAWPLLAAALTRWTDSDVPWLDALPTVASITGQVLLGQKRVENWPVWLAVNIFSAGLFAFKGLWLTALLYALFAALSVLGWRAWRAMAESPVQREAHTPL